MEERDGRMFTHTHARTHTHTHTCVYGVRRSLVSTRTRLLEEADERLTLRRGCPAVRQWDRSTGPNLLLCPPMRRAPVVAQ